jgi:hypothetical protein
MELFPRNEAVAIGAERSEIGRIIVTVVLINVVDIELARMAQKATEVAVALEMFSVGEALPQCYRAAEDAVARHMALSRLRIARP